VRVYRHDPAHPLVPRLPLPQAQVGQDRLLAQDRLLVCVHPAVRLHHPRVARLGLVVAEGADQAAAELDVRKVVCHELAQAEGGSFGLVDLKVESILTSATIRTGSG
jgi:hypothetical protein